MGESNGHDAWELGNGRSIQLDRPRVIAILNVTPDSFADGGRFASPEAVAEAAARAVEEGADALDVGGESTRPGAPRVGVEEQLARVTPAIQAIRRVGVTAAISVDTTRAPVARAALDAGADAVNDVSAGREDDGMLTLCAERGCGVILMHRLAPPSEDSYSDAYREAPRYEDVVADVRAFLGERLRAALEAGIEARRVVLDPGLGFGKSVGQNLELIERTNELTSLGRPVLSALSRKSFVGRLSLGRDSSPSERLAGTLALSVRHLRAGARLFRVHDVSPHVEALGTAWAAMRGDPRREYPEREVR
ncbi:MAG: dihydropteroate synthase [Phycisphaerales bacterium]